MCLALFPANIKINAFPDKIRYAVVKPITTFLREPPSGWFALSEINFSHMILFNILSQRTRERVNKVAKTIHAKSNYLIPLCLYYQQD